MPIYQGTSTKNKAEIIINSQQMGKVYVGDRLVWQKSVTPPIYSPEYGLLYNWYAVSGTGNASIASSDDWAVPTYAQYTTTLAKYLGGIMVAGGKMKETGYTYWNSPNTGADNSSGFNARASGYRSPQDGSFRQILNREYLRVSDPTTNVKVLSNNGASMGNGNLGSHYKIGIPLRLLYVGSGTPTEYVGNDGKRYRIVTIGTQIFLADNLAETRLRNGSIIPWHGATPANYFTDAEWQALTTAGMCAYNNDVNNVAAGFTFPT